MQRLQSCPLRKHKWLPENYCNLGFVAITMGPQGCVYATDEYMGSFPEYPANVVDTTGAGDTFLGEYLYWDF